MKKVKCKNCEQEVWFDDSVNEEEFYCSNECRYEAETGNCGEEY